MNGEGIMDTGFDELVRGSMSWFTDEVVVPARLAERARRHVRSQRRARMGWLTAAVVAGTTAVLVATAAGPAQPGRGGVFQVRLTAEVIRHVVTALMRMAATNSVEYARETVGPYYTVPDPCEQDCMVMRSRIAFSVTWYRAGVQHNKAYSADGQLIAEGRQVIGMRTATNTSINYPDRLWSRRTGPTDGPPLTRPVTRCVLDVEYWTPAQWARQMKQLDGCSNVQVQGRQWVDGVDAIKLQTHSKRVRTCGLLSVNLSTGVRHYGCAVGTAGYAGTLLIDPSTYLPIRFVSNKEGDAQRIDFRFLPPTPANLARLRLTIPPGFERV